MKKITLAIQAVKGGMDVKAAAQRYGVSETVLNDAIQKELLSNPLGFEGDTFKQSSNQKSETPAEKSFWDKAKDKANAFVKAIMPGPKKDVKGGPYSYEIETTNYGNIDLSNAPEKLQKRMFNYINRK